MVTVIQKLGSKIRYDTQQLVLFYKVISMPNLVDEGLITLSQAAKLFPRRRQGKAVHTTSLWRWCKYGVSRNGDVIKLEHVVLPSGIATSMEAVKRFINSLTSANAIVPSDRPTLTSKDVSKQLDKLGI